MFLSAVIVAALASICVGQLTEHGGYNVKVDHFSPQDTRTSHFHYEVNIHYYHEGGPLFIFIDDGSSTNRWIHEGIIFEEARELGGALLTTDIRYFGQNIPTETATLEDLQYLTIEQILSDIASFIITAKEHLDAVHGNKVFLYGSQWGGTIALLARAQYGYLVEGAWSTNGVFQPIVFAPVYYHALAENIRDYGSVECGDRLAAAFNQIEAHLNDEEDQILVDAFGICRPWNITDPMDIGLFSEGLIDQINQNIEENHSNGINSFCNALNAIPSDPFASLARWIRFTYNTDIGTCSNYDYVGKIQWASDTEWSNPGTVTGMRQNIYLQCTQIGQLRITQPNSIFGNRITQQYRQRICEESLGPEYNFEFLYQSVEYFEIRFGGKNYRGTHVFITNGLLDPWLSHGISTYNEPESHLINIPGYGKSADLHGKSSSDTTVMYNAKDSIKEAFRNWNFIGPRQN